MKRMPSRGEIWYVKLPTDSPEKAARPVIIVSLDARNRHLGASTVLVRRPGDFVSSVSLSTARKFSADFADSGAGDSNAAFIIAGTPY